MIMIKVPFLKEKVNTATEFYNATSKSEALQNTEQLSRKKEMNITCKKTTYGIEKPRKKKVRLKKQKCPDENEREQCSTEMNLVVKTNSELINIAGILLTFLLFVVILSITLFKEMSRIFDRGRLEFENLITFKLNDKVMLNHHVCG